LERKDSCPNDPTDDAASDDPNDDDDNWDDLAAADDVSDPVIDWYFAPPAFFLDLGLSRVSLPSHLPSSHFTTPPPLRC
jgi:hypothetical protein